MSSNSAQNTLLTATAMTAAIAVVGLSVAQSDVVSRKILSSERLQAKRMQEYSYRWQQSNEKALLRVLYALSGGVRALEEEDQIQKPPEPSMSKIWDKSSLEALIEEWIANDKQQEKEARNKEPQKTSVSPFPRILGISQQIESCEMILELYHPHSGSYQLPLLDFGTALADILESTITTTALCFVADASSGLGSRMVADLLEASKAGVAIIREPIWMASFADMAARRIIRQERLQKIIFGLCRMEALRVRKQVGEARTVMFTIPGQAVTPILLPLLQAAFPEDRHVFAYDSCAHSVERALAHRNRYRRATVPESMAEAFSFDNSDPTMSDPTRFTTPLRSGLYKSVLGLTKALAGVRLYHADTIQAWMASVDAFFKLKEDEKSTGYLPYTLKLGLLLDNPQGSLEPESDRYYSLASLMQFITGCRSRPLPEGVMDAAREWLRDFAQQHAKEKGTETKLTKVEKKALENCVFAHKLILIEDKTLKDTVLPRQHWTLKQAYKKGCACCAPEEEEDEEEEERNANNIDMAVGNSRDDSRPSAESNGNGYVDGKATFAFDPSKFSAPAPAPAPKRPKFVDGKTTFAFDPTKFS
ncbi:expressed unknown protein [Seminavis robusta]|uniref:Uncharacterized protein n=1 Tax=Seminavis robusta TaxID=568900 RepID=A0A9N8DKD0_9STRA|nr:expressed unknown protein [Seminavis robusta]|eukprot:Sro128_g061220.1 n/a (590) ;mRNA; f:54292-56277